MFNNNRLLIVEATSHSDALWDNSGPSWNNLRTAALQLHSTMMINGGLFVPELKYFYYCSVAMRDGLVVCQTGLTVNVIQCIKSAYQQKRLWGSTNIRDYPSQCGNFI